jgi:pimeloyl-ACP methyl ester carboxylesterase
MRHVPSADGTPIASEVRGAGPPVVLVAGMFCTRATLLPLAEALAAQGHAATVYDRRGRGASGGSVPLDAPPDVLAAREVDDLVAVVEAVGADGGAEADGRPVAVYGHSSGAGVALRAAAAGAPIGRLVLHEPPWGGDTPDEVASARSLTADVTAALVAGRPGDAIRRFLADAGMPDEVLDGMASDPAMLAVAATMPADLAVMGDHDGGTVPADLLGAVAQPTLVVAGGASPDFFRTTAERVAALLPHGSLAILDDADHGAPAGVVAPVVGPFLTG